ncbi:cytochrome P450 [Actinomadura monticuli]|uniref:Cytochrome P450 n=1 Tax=Actinomadura monticuli TaxID=3097367 RepID=A0ABV4Q6P1_9ACTN
MATRPEVIDLTDVDMFVRDEHHDAFSWLRANDPVYLNRTVDGDAFWALTRYRDVVSAYGDHTTFSSSGGAMLGGSFRNETDTASGRMLVASDPPRHRLLRQIMHQVFSPATGERVQEHVRSLVEKALSRMEKNGGADFATDVAPELPAGALMAIMGVSYEEAHHLIGLTRRMLGYRDPAFGDLGSDERVRLAEIQAEIFEFFDDLVRSRRRAPGDDLIGVLLRARINARPLDDEEILYNCLNVAVGGNETSSYSACSGMLALLNDPAQLRLLWKTPDLVDSAVGEILRWSSTNAYVQRVALRDVEFAGKHIGAGDVVTLWNVSANRDEDVFPRADRFDIERRPNRHLSYGSGIHRCIGAVFAQLELSILFRCLLDQGAALELAGEPERLRSNFILGITRLPIRLAGGGR